MSTPAAPWPVEIKVRRAARTLAVSFDTGEQFEFPAGFLRVMTPSASDRGHAGMRELAPLAIDKDAVGINDVQLIGRYAARIVFDDGHDTGLYTWPLLHRLGREQDKLTAQHRAALGR